MKRIYLMMLMISISCLSLADTIRTRVNSDGSVSIVPPAPLKNPKFRVDGLISNEREGGCALEGIIYRGLTLGGYYLSGISGANIGYGGKTFAVKCGGEKLKEQKNLSFSLATRLRLMKRMEIEASYSTKNTVGLTLRYLFGKSLGVGLGYLYIQQKAEETEKSQTPPPGSNNEQGETTELPPPIVDPPPPPPPN